MSVLPTSRLKTLHKDHPFFLLLQQSRHQPYHFSFHSQQLSNARKQHSTGVPDPSSFWGMTTFKSRLVWKTQTHSLFHKQHNFNWFFVYFEQHRHFRRFPWFLQCICPCPPWPWHESLPCAPKFASCPCPSSASQPPPVTYQIAACQQCRTLKTRN